MQRIYASGNRRLQSTGAREVRGIDVCSWSTLHPLFPLGSLRTGFSPRSLLTRFSLYALLSLGTLWALLSSLSLRTLRTLRSRFTPRTFGTGFAWISLVALRSPWAPFSVGTLWTGFSLFALRTLDGTDPQIVYRFGVTLLKLGAAAHVAVEWVDVELIVDIAKVFAGML